MLYVQRRCGMEPKSLSEARKEFHNWYMENSLDELSNKEILENLLFISCDNCNPKEIAQRLYDHFQGFDNIFNASTQQLMNVEGITESIAVYISVIADLIRRIDENKNKSIVNFSTKEARCEYAKNALQNYAVEHIILLTLDKDMNLIKCHKVSKGGANFSSIVPLDLITCISNDKPAYTMFAHNHPRSSAKPSNDDIYFAQTIAQWLGMLDVGVVDHIIVGMNEICSMREYSYSAKCVKWSS